MSIKHAFVTGVRNLLEKLYVPPVERFGKRTGIHDRFEDIHHSIDLTDVRRQELSAGGHTILVETQSIRQYNEVDQYQRNERPIMEDIIDQMDSDDVFYDVGAWIGTYTCLLAKAYPEAEIHTFEPGKERISQLKRNLAINDLESNVHPYGLAAKNETLYLTDSGKVTDTASEGNEQITIVNGDDFIERENHPPPTVMKIDIEGSEIEALRGLSNTISLDECRLIYCEVHPYLDVDASELDDLLRDHGFSTERFYDRDKVYFIRASK